jgi:hypothetical protein
MTDFLYTDARWTEHFVEVNNPHKEGHHVRFYFEPPQRTWVGLSEQDINELKFNLPDLYYWVDVVRATEKRLKEKNT